MTTETRSRYLRSIVFEDLQERMVFIGGPRQVGKTTFALGFLGKPDPSHPAYLNWDDVQDRRALLGGELPPGQNLVILDEIHKYARWRSLVKGFYDKNRGKKKILVTGSARLDHYSRGGDSLQGRYSYHRLHPFSLAELGGGAEFLALLLRFGGFPEPLFRGQEIFWRRWQRNREQRVIHDDIRDLESVRDLSLLDLLSQELPHRVGSPLSLRNLAEILQVSQATAVRWVSIFEKLYHCFLLPPFGGRKIRAVRKEQKLYLWDWSLVPEGGLRFENLVASHLLKYCHHREDTEGRRMELRYLRDTDRREVDFVVIEDGRPRFAVEAKTGERAVSPAVRYFKARTPIPKFYQVHLGARDYEQDGVRVLPFQTFVREAELV